MIVQSFTKKRLRFTFTLANSSVFKGSNSNVLILEGYRATVNAKSAGAPVAPSAAVQIYGMAESDMNALTMLAWKPLGLQRNVMKIEANNGGGWITVFTGQIIEAAPDYTAAPDVMMRAQAISLYYETLNPAAPTSYTGGVAVADIVQEIVKRIGPPFTFENNGVTERLQSPYLPNTLAEQLRSVCEQGNVDLYIDGDVIAIAPRGQPRKGEPVELNAKSGLIGYPTIDRVGIQVQCMYNPGLRFGGPVRVTSKVPKANGDWYIYSLDHYLQTDQPNGTWFSFLGLSEFGRTVNAR